VEPRPPSSRPSRGIPNPARSSTAPLEYIGGTGWAGGFRNTGSDSQDRMGTTIAHTATLVRMKDGSRYVFDWHATLTASNPMLHASTKAFDEKEGVLFTVFQEFA
jgi:hypothetical protein